MPKHTRVQVIYFKYLPKELGFIERSGYHICSTPNGIMEIPKDYVELVPWNIR